MNAAIISGNSEKDFQLLVSIAEKMGLSVKLLSADDQEALNMAKASADNEVIELAEHI